MAGTCKQCGCLTTNTRGASAKGLCFTCEHGLVRDVVESPEPEWNEFFEGETEDGQLVWVNLTGRKRYGLTIVTDRLNKGEKCN